MKLVKATGERFESIPFHAERNARGAFAMGIQPDRLPGGPVDDAESRSEVRELWGGNAKKPGLTAPEMIQAAANGKLKALYIVGSDVLKDFPDRELLTQALDSVETLIVQDNFPSWISAKANIVLPGNIFIEGFGSYADLSAYVVRSGLGRRPLQRIPAQQHVDTLGQIIKGLGSERALTEAHDIFDRILKMIDVSETLDYDALQPDGPGESAPIWITKDTELAQPIVSGKPYSYRSTFNPIYRLDNNAVKRSKAFEGFRINKNAAAADSLTLTWGTLIMGDDPWLNFSQALDEVRPNSELEMHPRTAERFGVAHGDQVVVSPSENGEGIRGELKVTEQVAPGCVFAPQNCIDFELSAGLRALPTVHIRKEN